MKKLLFIICILLLAPLSRNDVEIRKNRDEIERIKQHLKTKQITIPATNKIIFGNTYLAEDVDGDFQITIGVDDSNEFRFRDNDFFSEADGDKNLGANTSNDWNVIYYHTLSQDSGKDKKKNISIVGIGTLKADRLPDPKIYERKTKPGVIEYGLIAEDCPEELIKYDDEGNPMIQTNAVIAYLCGVIKEMDKRIVELEK